MEKYCFKPAFGASSMTRFFAAILLMLLTTYPAFAMPGAASIREAAEFIVERFGKGTAGRSVDEVAESAAEAVATHGPETLGFLRASGHSGFVALKEAGDRAGDIVRLYVRKGDEAIWLISNPHKLAIYLKHGDLAADAMLKYPGIAENLIERFGDDAVRALNGISRQSAQRLNIIEREGLLTSTPQSADLLAVVSKHGDEAMEFIWRNKGGLTVATFLGTFIANPQTYISGAAELVIEPIVSPIVRSTNWSLIISVFLIIFFLPLIARSIRNARSILRTKE